MDADFMIERCMDFIMDWIVGLPITLGGKCDPYLRPIFLAISLLWIPAMFVICLPFMIPLMIVSAVEGLWDCMKD